jgi:hypothetical protein
MQPGQWSKIEELYHPARERDRICHWRMVIGHLLIREALPWAVLIKEENDKSPITNHK